MLGVFFRKLRDFLDRMECESKRKEEMKKQLEDLADLEKLHWNPTMNS